MSQANTLFLKAVGKLKKGHKEEAITLFNKVISNNPNHSKAYYNLGIIYSKLNAPKAIDCYKKAIKIEPENAVFYYNLGNIYFKDDLNKAIVCYQQAVSINPKLDDALSNIGSAYLLLGQYQQAKQYFKKTLALNPKHLQSLFHLAWLDLLYKNYLTGFKNYRYRYDDKKLNRATEIIHKPSLLKPNINIANKKILVNEEQGWGDIIQFVRFLPSFVKQGADVTFSVSASLKRLFTYNFPQVQFIDKSTPCQFDYNFPIMESGYILGVSYNDIPSKKYLTINTQDRDRFVKKHLLNNNKIKVGINPQGSGLLNNDNRSLSLALLLAQLDLNNPSLTYYSLQYQISDSDKELLKHHNIAHLADNIGDFYDTAVMLDAMDVVVTVDTSLAHLSGALGKKTCILLPYRADWRWGEEGTQTNWYEGGKLFRQAKINDWFSAIKSLNSYLTKETLQNNPLLKDKAYYKKQIEKNSNNVDAYVALGSIYAILKKMTKAENCFKKALKIKPECIDCLYNYGLLLSNTKQLKQAKRLYKKALKLDPNYYLASYNLANIYSNENKVKHAEKYYKQTIKSKPNYVGAYSNLGALYIENNQLNLSLPYLEQAVKLAPSHDTYANLGNLKLKLYDNEGAIACFEKALTINSQLSVTYCDLGFAYQNINNINKALENYQKALVIEPDYWQIIFNLSFLHLLMRNYTLGFECYRSRYDDASEDTMIKLKYKSRLLTHTNNLGNKTLLVEHEQGYGDSIHFVRFLPWFVAKKMKVICKMPKPLKRLFAVNYPQISFVSDKKYAEFDYYMPMLESGYLQKLDYFHLKNNSLYLKISKQESQAIAKKYAIDKNKTNIAINYRGSSLHKKDALRSIALNELITALNLTNKKHQYYSLQYQPSKDEKLLFAKHNIINVSDSINDFYDAALLLNNMDLVISVDTAIAHLSGAMGKKTWLLLPYAPDWRWGLNDVTTNWYKSMTLFRQTQVANWQDILEEVKQALNSDENPTPINIDFFKYAIDKHKKGQLDEAKKYYKKLLIAEPNHIDGLLNLGVIYAKQNQFIKAEANFKQVLSVASNHASANSNLGALYTEHNHKKALKYLQNTVSLEPKNPIAFNNLGCLYTRIGEHNKALECYKKAVMIDANYVLAQYHLALHYLLHKHYTIGFKHYQSRYHPNKEDRNTFLIDQSRLLQNTLNLKNKTLLVTHEQGYGDSIHFVRFLPWFIAKNMTVICQVPQPLKRLFTANYPQITFIGDKEHPVFDYHMPMMESGYLQKIDYFSLDSAPYLKVDAQKSQTIAKKLIIDKNKTNIAINYRGSALHKKDALRSIPLTELITALNLSNPLHQYYSLQYQPSEDEKLLFKQHNIINLADVIDDFYDAALLLDNMDLVISVDTAIAHLSGAIGKKTWLLLAYAPDWRWGLNDAKTNWYNSLNLYRQANNKGWKQVLLQVKDDLKQNIDIALMTLNQKKAHYQQLIQNEPHNAEAYYQLGRLLIKYSGVLNSEEIQGQSNQFTGNLLLGKKSNKNKQAIEYLKKAVSLNKNYIEAFLELGNSYQKNKQYELEINSYKQVIALQPKNAKAHYQLALAYIGIVNAVDKETLTNNIKSTYLYNTHNKQIASCLLKSIELDADNGLAIYQLAKWNEENDDLEKAEEYYLKAIKLVKNNSPIYVRLGILLSNKGDFNKAISAYHKAIEKEPKNDQAYYNLSLVYILQKQPSKAKSLLLKAIAINPDYALANYNLGLLYMEQNQLERAKPFLLKAINASPEYMLAKFSLSILMLKNKDYKEGFKQYRYRYHKDYKEGNVKVFHQETLLPSNTNIKGKTLLVSQEQGYGDIIQFVRFLPSFVEQGAKVICAIPKSLSQLFEFNFPTIQFTTLSNTFRFDYNFPLLDAAYLLGITYKNIPNSQGYISVKKADIKSLNKQHFFDSKKLKVAINYQGSKKHKNDKNRSLKLSQIISALPTDCANVQYYSVQHQATEQEKKLLKKHGIIDLATNAKDFNDVAVILSQMDLLISVDTALAHLNGALGKNTWVILPYAPDWRWGLNDIKTNWYKSTTLFRQAKTNHWVSVLKQIKIAIKQLANNKN